MAIITLPIDAGVPFQAFQLELDAVVYGFEFRWNHRAETWSMTLKDGAGVVLAAGIRLCFGTLLLRAGRPLSQPRGELLLVDASSESGDPTLETLGRDVVVTYADVSEVAAVVPAP